MGLIKLAFDKEAGLWDGILKGGLAAGKALMGNNTVRNAAIGAGVGAVTGAVNAESGQRMSGALKGGLLGGALGGVSTAGSNIYKNMKPGIGPGMSFGGALRQEGGLFKNTLSSAKWQGQNAYAVGAGKASSIASRQANFSAPKAASASASAPAPTPDFRFSKRYSNRTTSMPASAQVQAPSTLGYKAPKSTMLDVTPIAKKDLRSSVILPSPQQSSPIVTSNGKSSFERRALKPQVITPDMTPITKGRGLASTLKKPTFLPDRVSKRYSDMQIQSAGSGMGIIPNPIPAPTPQGSGAYKAAIDRGWGNSSIKLSDFKVHPQDPRLKEIPAIIRQKQTSFTEADLASMGIK